MFGGASGYSPSEGAQSGVWKMHLTDTTEENSQQSTSSSECEDDEKEQHRRLVEQGVGLCHQPTLSCGFTWSGHRAFCNVAESSLRLMLRCMNSTASDVRGALMCRRLELALVGKRNSCV